MSVPSWTVGLVIDLIEAIITAFREGDDKTLDEMAKLVNKSRSPGVKDRLVRIINKRFGHIL